MELPISSGVFDSGTFGYRILAQCTAAGLFVLMISPDNGERIYNVISLTDHHFQVMVWIFQLSKISSCKFNSLSMCLEYLSQHA